MKRALVLAAAIGLLAAGAASAQSARGRRLDRVNPRTIDSYKFFFDAGETSRIQVIGDGSTDLDLYIVDENGNVVLADEDGTDNCVVFLTPKWTGPFMVRIVNRGAAFNTYVMKID